MPEQPNDNPYNIDHERERRLIRLFVISIATAFIVAALALAIAITVDLVTQEGQQPVPDDFPTFDEREVLAPNAPQ